MWFMGNITWAICDMSQLALVILSQLAPTQLASIVKGVVNWQNSRDKGPPEGNSARG